MRTAPRSPLFFASSDDLTTRFDHAMRVVDPSRSHVWDASTVAALDAIGTRYRARGTAVVIRGLNDASRAIHGRLAGRLGDAH
jgi:SulP family sulfate permease